MKHKKTLPQQQKHLFDKPSNVTRVIRLLLALCMLLFALDFVLQRHSSHPWETIPGFYALFGFIGCVLLVIIAKGLRRLLMRPTNYYTQHKQDGAIKQQEPKRLEDNNVDP